MWNNPLYVSEKEYKDRIQPKWIQYCRNKLDNNWAKYYGKRRDVEIENLYWEGRVEGYLYLMDFESFKKMMTKEWHGFYYNRRPWNHKRLYKHNKYNHNNGEKFQQRGYEKKTLTEHEQAKREWREFKKDRRSQKFYKNYRGVKQQFKDDCARLHRSFEKQCIQNADYDKLHDRTWKQCIDWWSYD